MGRITCPYCGFSDQISEPGASQGAACPKCSRPLVAADCDTVPADVSLDEIDVASIHIDPDAYMKGVPRLGRAGPRARRRFGPLAIRAMGLTGLLFLVAAVVFLAYFAWVFDIEADIGVASSSGDTRVSGTKMGAVIGERKRFREEGLAVCPTLALFGGALLVGAQIARKSRR